MCSMHVLIKQRLCDLRYCRCRYRRRENMVGVNRVLAESVKFKHGLYKSYGIEWFESIMLEACLLQPCFHVAGRGRDGEQTDPRRCSP